ncbi:MAG: hypothetical protein R3182_11370, partial [Draconibacterium sp.]|nr:hypothetical protein [Draconibacterium sp.]
AISYNPIELDEYRYPLIVISSDDGIVYDDMVLVQGEVPPRRFMGRWKDFGPCYVRGIVEGNGNPPGNDMWLTYSMNKEDMWVSRVPLPIRYKVEGNINDNFNKMETGGAIVDWNIYSPKWCPLNIVEFPSEKNKSILLEDKDPYDYARAIRVFEESEKVEIDVKVFPKQTDNGIFEIDVTDRYGNRPVRIRFDKDGKIKTTDGSKETVLQPYKLDTWYNLKIQVDAKPYGSFSVSIDNNALIKNAKLAEAVKSVERISFRTGAYRNLPARRTPNQDPAPPLPGADEPVGKIQFYVDDLSVKRK